MAQASSQSLVRQWLQHYTDELLLFFRRRVDEADAADLTQEMCVRLLEYPAAGSIREPRAFLFRMAANLAIDHLRKRAIRPITVDDEVWDAVPAVQPGPDDNAIGSERLARFQAALAELPEAQRHAFLLNRFDGLTQAQIAERIGLSEKTVQRYIVRALEHCRTRLEGA